VEKILIDIMRKGDDSGSSVTGAKKLKKENWVLLDNFLPKDNNSLANARAKSIKSHSKRSKSHMSMKQHRWCGSFNFPKEFHKLVPHSFSYIYHLFV
jgi:ribonuclease P protein subunit POP4